MLPGTGHLHYIETLRRNIRTLFMDEINVSIIIISFIATWVRSTFGFGESLVAVPLLMLFLPVKVAVPLSVLLSVLVAAIVVVQDHSKIHWRSAKWLVLSALPGIPAGLALLLYGSEAWVKRGLGMLMCIYSLYALFGKKKIRLHNDSRPWLLLCGFFSGVFGGAYGLNGPPLVIYGNMRQWSAAHFRATLQAYFLPASAIGMVGYVLKGLVTAEVLSYFLMTVPAVIPAVWLGRYCNHRLKNDSFFSYLYVALLLIGCFLIVNTIT